MTKNIFKFFWLGSRWIQVSLYDVWLCQYVRVESDAVRARAVKKLWVTAALRLQSKDYCWPEHALKQKTGAGATVDGEINSLLIYVPNLPRAYSFFEYRLLYKKI